MSSEIRFYREYGRNGNPDLFFTSAILDFVPRVGELIDLYHSLGERDAIAGTVMLVSHHPLHPTGSHVRCIVRIAPQPNIGNRYL